VGFDPCEYDVANTGASGINSAPGIGAPTNINSAGVVGAGVCGVSAVASKKFKPLYVVIPIAVVVLVVLVVFLVWNLIPSANSNSGAGDEADSLSTPDVTVSMAILDAADADKDGKVSSEEAAAVTSLIVSDASDLTGAEILVNLKELNLQGGSMQSVEVPNLPSLVKVDATSCQDLESLKLSGLANLEEVVVEDVPLNDLDVSGCTNLKEIKAENTNIGELDLSDNKNLITLTVGDNTVVTGLDNTKLTEYWVLTSYTWEIPAIDAVSRRWASAKCSYDENLNLAHIETSESIGSDSPTVTTYNYFYDSNNVCTGVDIDTPSTNTFNKCTVTYDDLGRVATFSSSQDGDCVYTYDTNSINPSKSVQGVGNGAGSTMTYNYDSMGRLASFAIVSGGSPARIWTLGYDDEGYVSSCICELKGIATSMSYASARNSKGQLQSVSQDVTYYIQAASTLEYSYSNGVLSDLTRTLDSESGYHDLDSLYPVVSAIPTYDANGNLVNLSVTYGGVAGADKTADITYGYSRYFSTDADLDIVQPLNNDNVLLPFADGYVSIDPDRSLSDNIDNAVYSGLPAVFYGVKSGNYLASYNK
jgi:hypothetical protein